MENSVIVEDTDTGREVIATPIENGSEMITERAYTPYNSETNSTSSQMLFDERYL